MRFFKLKTLLLALILSVVTLGLHLGCGFLFHGIIKSTTFANIWQESLRIYWSALSLIRFLGPIEFASPLASLSLMILAGLVQWWAFFAAGIWLIRLYFRKPPISVVAKISIAFGVLVVAVCYYKLSPEALGDLRSPLERAMSLGETQKVEKILKSNPSLANKPFRFGSETPLFYATMCRNPKTNIDLLIASGADINAKSGGFDLTPLQQAAWSGKLEAVEALLFHKPDVNATTKDGDTALTYAFVADSKEVFNLLLDNGADINHGRSALAECMIYGGGKDSWPEYLLSKGADPNRKGTDADRFEPLIQAVINGNTNYVAALLRYHVSLNVRYVNGADDFSPLELALDEGHMDIAFMIQDYALKSRSNTVSFAAAHGDLDKLRSLLKTNPQSIEEKDELGLTPLAWAAEAGQAEAADLLLSLGANPNAVNSGGRYPIDWAATAGHLRLVEMLADKTSNNQGITLFFAIQQQQVPVAKFLLEHGANPNFHYPACNLGTPLNLAAQQGNVEAARLLLEHGADVNGQDGRCGQGNYTNDTPLDSAVGSSSSEMVELLFTNGAVIPHKYPGYLSMFHEWALGTGNTNVAALLLSHGADVNAKDSEGKTPLHFAVQQGTFRAVEWLLKNGADVNARDKRGTTPLSLTKFRNRGREIEKRKDVADLLRSYGAKD